MSTLKRLIAECRAVLEWDKKYMAPHDKLESEPGYLYHATNQERAYEVAKSGLKLHKPWAHTDQDYWPDKSTEKRSYFSPKAHLVHSFAPEEGPHVVLRTKHTNKFKEEGGTGDVYATHVVKPHELEILDKDGKWGPLSALAED